MIAIFSGRLDSFVRWHLDSLWEYVAQFLFSLSKFFGKIIQLFILIGITNKLSHCQYNYS